MKTKIFKVLLLSTFLVFILFLCWLCVPSTSKVDKLPRSNTYTESGTSIFVEIERTKYWRIVYNTKTKVMYAVSSEGQFTLLVKPDGGPMTYEEG